MSECIHCNYPYTTFSKCPNCGSKDPDGSSSRFSFFIIAILFLVILFLSPGIFITSFIHYFLGFETNIIWFSSILISLFILGYLYFNYKENVLKYYLYICGGVVLSIILFSLLKPNNIFLKTVNDMFNQEKNIDCIGCGGDGEIDSAERLVFLDSDILTDEASIKNFQDWMDKNQPLWIEIDKKFWNLNKGTDNEPNRHLNGKGYGEFDLKTSIVYKKYKYDWFPITEASNCILCSNSE
jgi:hypothetical protein